MDNNTNTFYKVYYHMKNFNNMYIRKLKISMKINKKLLTRKSNIVLNTKKKSRTLVMCNNIIKCKIYLLPGKKPRKMKL